jgi:hypothetical protein
MRGRELTEDRATFNRSSSRAQARDLAYNP